MLTVTGGVPGVCSYMFQRDDGRFLLITKSALERLEREDTALQAHIRMIEATEASGWQRIPAEHEHPQLESESDDRGG